MHKSGITHLTHDTNGKVTNSQLYTTKEVSPFPAGDHKAQINEPAQIDHLPEHIKQDIKRR